MYSSYYHQKFVSPNSLFAEVKEELSSYFLAGALDDIMFPKWTEHCLKQFRKSAFKIEQTVLHLKDYQACLPDNFESVRELWLCTVIDSIDIQSPSACYYQKDCRIDIPQITDRCDPCFDEGKCSTKYMVTHKLTNSFYFSFSKSFLLQPGNVSTISKCGDNCDNLGVSCEATFDIINNQIVTNFPTGTLYLMYYSDTTEEGEQLVPDNYWLQDYIRKFIIFKCFKKLANIVTDESINIIERKLAKAEQEQLEALIIAQTEFKKETIQDKIRKIVKSYNENNKYRIR